MLTRLNRTIDPLLDRFTIKQQISAGFILMIGILMLSGLASYIGVNFIIRDANEMADSNRLDAELAQREVDHLMWVNQLNTLFTDDSVTRLQVSTDDRQCALGRWLYGEGRQQAEKLLPSLAPLLRELEQPHFRLHQSAARIEAQFRPADQHLTNYLRNIKIRHLEWLHSVKDALMDPEIGTARVQTDPRQCALGRWLYSSEFRQRRQLTPELASFWQKVEEPHTQLHESVVRINELLAENRRQAAIDYFHESTMPAGEATLAAIDDTLAWLDENLAGYQAAQATYTRETLTALAEVQSILHRIRKHVGDNLVSDEGLLHTAWGLKIRVSLVILLGLAVGLGITWPLTIRLSRTLERAAREVEGSSSQVAVAAQEIASSSQSLSDTAASQASSVEETSAALEEIAAQSAQMVELTEGSEKLMRENIKKSGQSLKALAELTQSMTQIEKDSGQIRSIIATIDSIAFQTNLLALNAAVEAARAGEAGAGFAVVADEVKNLAMKTAQEANQIQQLLDTTVARITSCAGSLKEINQDFDDIVETATTIGDKNSAITEATEQQAKGVQQITEATHESSDATQRIAAAAEQSAAASEELSAQSEELKKVVAELEKMVFGSSHGQTATSRSQAASDGDDDDWRWDDEETAQRPRLEDKS
ncbi:methyl-accepting chemotaxis protein [Desulfurivibrio alkaliphilus]|uniref:Methyl-accepting chemotaxis sensory transducer n=1 Tax=Desulfurivibrio alkaliphilus (strain DSM 19089 / UNIQEM U267 / AHT2) TaxID=589865 RepID=D6Z6I9_DESAT|nr:methyl-accepting chemotaxis protein [Desulfurivibrio alkaliphilus]ADH84948.1 methyl-accepting chemotaxis sensory transducer [Desulfurivibrio alkaliphilus AHT 2]